MLVVVKMNGQQAESTKTEILERNWACKSETKALERLIFLNGARLYP